MLSSHHMPVNIHDRKMQDLTIRQRKALKVYLDGGSNQEIAIAGGADPSQDPGKLANRGAVLIRMIRDRVPLQEMMESAGLSDELIFRKLREGMDATEVKIATDHGSITDERVYADYSTRRGYIDLTAKMKGLLKEQVEQKVEATFTFHIKGRDDPRPQKLDNIVDVTPKELEN